MIKGEQNLSKSEKAIYNTLEFYKNANTNLCCPTIIQISEKVGLGPTQTKKLLKKLKELGLINIIPIKNTHGNFYHNSYTLTDTTTKTITVSVKESSTSKLKSDFFQMPSNVHEGGAVSVNYKRVEICTKKIEEKIEKNIEETRDDIETI